MSELTREQIEIMHRNFCAGITQDRKDIDAFRDMALRSLALPSATERKLEPVSVYVENVDDKDAALVEFGKLVDGAALFSGKLPMLVENGLCIALTGTGPLGIKNAYRIADALNAAAPAPAEPVGTDDPNESGWTPEGALRFYAAGRHFDTVDGRTRILDTGSVASDALKALSPEYDTLKGNAPTSARVEGGATPPFHSFERSFVYDADTKECIPHVIVFFDAADWKARDEFAAHLEECERRDMKPSEGGK